MRTQEVGNARKKREREREREKRDEREKRETRVEEDFRSEESGEKAFRGYCLSGSRVGAAESKASCEER